MKLKFIGNGGAFAPMSRGNSNMLITENGKNMMVDFGTTAPYILRDELKIDLNTIDLVYISHAHADHCGGLEFFAFSRYFMPKLEGGIINYKVKPNLVLSDNIEKSLWENTLKGGLEILEGKKSTLNDYFNVFPVSRGFGWQNLTFDLVKTPHIMDSYGLFINTGKNKVLITTDTSFNPSGLEKCYNEATVIFHDTETLSFKTGVHANYMDLKTLPYNIKKKIWMYHYGEKISSWREDGFAGFVEKGQEFDL